MSGTLAGPAGPLATGAAGAIGLSRRLWVAIAVALAMHAALLAIRPGGLAGSHVAPAAKAMAVRMVLPLASDESPVPANERASVAAPAATPAQDAAPAQDAPAPAVERGPAPAPVRTAKAARDAAQARALASRREPGPSIAPAAPPPAMPSSAETALPAAPDYAFGVRLDPGPRPLEDIEPEYPDVHLREGTVVLRLLISEAGRVDNVAVVRSDPRGVFEQAALDAFGKARFAPGLAAGTPVKSQITVEVRFVPVNRGARVSGRTY